MATQRLTWDSISMPEGVPAIRKLHLNTVIRRESEHIYKYETTNTPMKNICENPEKVIMVVGATGAGKTTLINGLVNYILDVKWDDSFRYKLIDEKLQVSQAQSQTTGITSYTIYHKNAEFPYVLTIVDTPGFGDTSGIKHDKKITEQIHNFFSTQGTGGIDHIDAIGFVSQASLARLTPTQKYVFESILSLFGKDIADNIFIMATFADAQSPPLMASIKALNLPCIGYFKFNNSALYAKNKSSVTGDMVDEEDEEEFNKMFWDMGRKSVTRFLKKLAITDGKSLQLTRGVLDERGHLEVFVIGIQKGIQKGLKTLEQLRIEQNVLSMHEAEVDANKNFTYTITEVEMKKKDTPPGTFITNCLQCSYTCHYPCGIPKDEDKERCWAMTDGNCRICPGRCVWSVHYNTPFEFYTETVTKEKTSDELLSKYKTAQGKKQSAKQVMSQISYEFDEVQFEVLKHTEAIRKSLNRLKEIALRPNPLSSVGYIDILIENAKGEGKVGWQDNVKHLKELRSQAEVLQTVEMEGFNPFAEYETVKCFLVKERQGGFAGFFEWIKSKGKGKRHIKK